jgi:hypothetical protein
MPEYTSNLPQPRKVEGGRRQRPVLAIGGTPAVQDDDFHTGKVLRKFCEHSRQESRNVPSLKEDHTQFQSTEHRIRWREYMRRVARNEH